MATPWNAIATGGSALLGALSGIGRGSRETRRNKELMKYQNSMNIDFWNMQNEYNKPLNQMKRFKEAGLNPALMYGQGNPGNASSLQSANYTPHKETPVDTGAFSTGMLQYQQGQSIDAQRKNINADTILKTIEGHVKAGTINEQKGLVKEQLNNLMADTNTKNQSILESIKKVALMDKQMTKTEQETENIKIQKALGKLDLDFYKKSKLSPSDSPWIKLLWRVSNDSIEAFGTLLKWFTGKDVIPPITIKN